MSMNLPTVIEINRENLQKHPAVQAWSRLRLHQVRPARIESLKHKHKSAIYRMAGIGPAGTNVIAKRSLASSARTERLIYEEILPRLPLPALHCFGSVDDDDPQFCWLFLEDAGNDPYQPLLPEHRAAAVLWLVVLHTRSDDIKATAQLPGRGPEYYLERLRLARANITGSLGNPALKADGRAVLVEILARFDFLESRWDRVKEFCEGKPQTLVHGDLKEKNVRIRSTPDQVALLTFDWEIAGRGVPATDLFRCPDLPAYLSSAQKFWPDLHLADLRRLADVGVIFRSLIAVYWKSLALSGEWIEWPVEKIRIYHQKLAQTMQALDIR
jgi:hypothetical protein